LFKLKDSKNILRRKIKIATDISFGFFALILKKTAKFTIKFFLHNAYKYVGIDFY